MAKISKDDFRLIKEAGIMLVGILAAWFLLQGRVKALEVKFGDLVTREQANKQQFVDLVKTVQKIHDNQLIIGVTLGVEGLRE